MTLFSKKDWPIFIARLVVFSFAALFVSIPALAEEAISVARLFEDGIRREGSILIAGPIVELEAIPQIFDETKLQKLKIVLGEEGWRVNIFAKNQESFAAKTFKKGDIVAVSGEVKIIEDYATVFGTVLTNGFTVAKWSKEANNSTNDKVIKVSEYFDRNMRVGNSQVTLTGSISDRQEATVSAQIMYTFTHHGHKLIAYSHPNFNITANKELLQSIKVGDNVSLTGKFFMEQAPIYGFEFSEVKKDVAFEVDTQNNATAAEEVTSAIKSEDTLNTTSDIRDSLSAELEREDLRLNQNYKLALGQLPETEKSELRAIQRSWIKDRDRECAEKSSEFAGGTLEAITRLDCILIWTKKRADELAK